MTRADQCIARCRAVLEHIGAHLARQVGDEAHIDTRRLDEAQIEIMGLASHLARITAAEAVVSWGAQHGKMERDLARTWCAMVAADLFAWAGPRKARLGLSLLSPDPDGFVAEALDSGSLTALGAQVAEHGGGDAGLDETHTSIRDAFARFSDNELAPLAERIHRDDVLVPEPLLAALAAMGVFGISIPETYGGSHVDHLTMIVATEELSRGSLGAGGSVITRPEICAKALLAGGSEDQKQRWLPAIAEGRHMVSVAVTEPDAGSDVAGMRTVATRVEGGYRISGEKTWCTFAGRADLLFLLARTGGGGHRGLSLFLVDKPPTRSGEGDEYRFDHHQDAGGQMVGHAISTVGYRGMHSFSIRFDDWFVSDDRRIGEEGQGFYLVMEGFSGGRLQTAARAIGVMEAALRETRTYVQERHVFGRPLSEMPLTQAKLAQMAARIQASRQLAYQVGHRMDRGGGAFEAALVKLMSCREAEWVTREAMQLHGGMGYAEEYPVSRYWLDARVLSIFEGAEEVLGVRVIGRGYLAQFLSKAERSAK
jgi:(2S)-methylsuccinyl-CoA dehydrogenase